MIGLLKRLLTLVNQVEGKFEMHFRSLVESVGGPEQRFQCCFADITREYKQQRVSATSTGSGLLANLSCDFEQTFRQIVSIRVKTLSNTNLVASMYIKGEKSSLLVDVRR